MAEFSIIVPVFNEAGNIVELYTLVVAAMGDTAWEMVFVDDESTDGTSDAIRELCMRDPRVRTLRRVGRRGLSSACIEGILSTTTEAFAVIDGDLQHDETRLPEMLRLLQSGTTDLVIGSRYMAGGAIGDWSASRARMSLAATRLARIVTKRDLTDPMSGFFAMRRDAFDVALPQLSGQGFKILLDICASSPPGLRSTEIPYEFKSRLHGESKLDSIVILEYLLLVINKATGVTIPLKFILFSIVGTLGLGLHLMILYSGLSLGWRFDVAQAVAVLSAMTFNFFLNNSLTYRDRRLKGSRLIWGLLSFYAICSFGAAANVGVAAWAFYEGHYSWQISAVTGVVVGVVWNYVATSFFTWGKPRRKT
jgi:dolichol-phosphate mannosyltransferase